jgi:hypothetical protein
MHSFCQLTSRLILRKELNTTPSYDEWGLETTKLTSFTQPQQLLKLQIVADFPSTAKLS